MIRSERRDAVLLLTIDRVERRNALNGELCEALGAELAAGADARAVVITGAGSAFCAGADLVTRFGADGSGEDTFRPAFEVVLDAISEHPVPVIAAVNGPAMGAGMQLAVACDLRVAGATARFAIPGGRLGIHLSARNIWRLADLLGQGAARDFLLAGRSVDAEGAERIGLAQYRVDDALATAFEVAEGIAASAPLTVRGHKRALDLVAEARWLGDAARAEITAREVEAFASDDLREGMAAFAEKRAPRFTGR